MMQFSVRVLNGLPLIAEVEYADDRDEGVIIEQIQLYDRNGRRADWAERKMSTEDWSDLEYDILENFWIGC